MGYTKKSVKRSAMSKRRRSTRKTKRGTVTVTRKIRPRTLPISQEAHVKQLVKLLINRDEETKFVTCATSENHNSGIGSSADCHRIIPSVVHGTAANQRVGDKISPKYLKVTIKLRLADNMYSGGNLLFKPFEARILGLHQKTIKSWPWMSDFDYARLLAIHDEASGTANVQAYQGNVNDNMYPINTDTFKVWMDERVMFAPQFQSGGTLPGGTVQFPLAPNEVTFVRYVKCPAHFTFDEQNGDFPNNFCPFVVAGYSYVPGTSPDLATTQLCVTTHSQLVYKDA